MPDILGLSEVRWWDSDKYSSPTCRTALFYSAKPSGSKRESSVGLLLITTEMRTLMTCEPFLDRILTARLRSKLKSITTAQCYASMEVSDIVEKNTFCKHAHAVQEKLPKITLRWWWLGDGYEKGF